MVNNIPAFDREFIDKNNLFPEAILSDKPGRRVYLVLDEIGNKKILKINVAFLNKLEREQAFLKAAAKFNINSLKIPTIYLYEKGCLLMEFIGRKAYNRETIESRDWNNASAELWVLALREFQKLPLSSKGFSISERIKGWAYPAVRMLQLLPSISNKINAREINKCILLATQYILIRPEFKNVTTHYDLQTFNYTPTIDESRMSLIDFEMGAYKGDNLYDALYYLSIPVTALHHWKFQKLLLSLWVKQFANEKESQAKRIQLILAVISIQRFFRFKNDSEKQQIYFNNLRLILNDKKFNDWLKGILAN
jgi:hypothetical protein